MQSKVLLDSSLTENADTGYVQSIVNFLQKPVPVDTITVSTTSVGEIGLINLPGDVLSKPIFTNKISGFYAWRATAVVRIQTNANRFQQGRILLHFLPQATVDGMRTDQLRNVNLMTKTQQPRVELDVSTQSEAIIEIPYISPYTHYDIQGGRGNMGTLYYSMYSPLQIGTGGSNTFDFTVWVSFKDIEIITPSSGLVSFGTQMDEDMSTGNFTAMGKSLAKDVGNDLGATIKSTVAKPTKSKGSSNEKKESHQSWASTLGQVATASALTATVPALTWLAAPVAGVSMLAAGICSIFGWSKPALGHTNTSYVKLGSSPFMANSDGVDTSVVLANSYQNELQVLPGFAGNDMDEMSIASIVSRPAFFTDFTWSTTNNTGDNLLNLPLSPGDYYERLSVSNTTHTFVYETHTPLSFLSRYFRYYRGDIRVTFKIVKTEFHSGRLILSYTPGQNSVIPNNEDTTYLFREVLDIRNGNEFSYVFPFASTSPYRPTLERAIAGTDSLYGYMHVSVLNELVAPASVSNSITFLVEVSAAEGFELAVPCFPRTSNFSTGDQFEPFYTQMNDADDLIIAKYKPVGSSKQVGQTSLLPSFACIGERVLSIKQLLLRFQKLRVGTGGPSGGNNNNVFEPFALGGLSRPLGTTGNVVTPPFYGDYLSHFSGLYAYARGSVRMAKSKWATSNDRTETILYLRHGILNDVSFSSSDIPDSIGPTNNLVAFHNSDQNNCFTEIRAPPYMSLPSRLNRYDFGQSLLRPPVDIYRSPVIVKFNQSDVAGGGTSWWRAVGDDFQLGYFVGVPPFYIRSVAL